MKLLFSFFVLTSVVVGSGAWLTDFNQARIEASKSNKDILLNFSGSDWCIPCIRLHKDVFESSAFQSFADQHLVLVNADFPRLRKNQLSKVQTRKNESLADLYNKKGSFPLTVLLNAQGHVIHEWEGVPSGTPEQFVQQLGVYAGQAASK
jgi:thioredoxin-related protein